MLAAQYSEFSKDYSAIQVHTVEKPVPGPGQVVVKVHSASINPIDCKVHKGHASKVYGWPMDLPFKAGYDFAGVVDSTGEDVDGFSQGERVYAVNWGQSGHYDAGEPGGGAFAEYILISAAKVSKIPQAVSFDQAAAVALAGTTAYQVLFDAAKVTPGQRILIIGGSTSVGHLAIQLAKERGAWVATTASTRNAEFVSQFGADLLINYNTEQWETLPELQGLDAVIDTVGEKDAFARATQTGVVKTDGAFVSIAGMEAGLDPAAHAPLHFAAFFLLSNSASVQDELVSRLASGALKVQIDETFPFTTEGVQGLFKKVASNSSTGKNILRIM